jgi:hypothetical protein
MTSNFVVEPWLTHDTGNIWHGVFRNGSSDTSTDDFATNLDILCNCCCDNHSDSGVVLCHGRVSKNPVEGPR